MSNRQKEYGRPMAAIILSFVAGIWILIAAGSMSLWYYSGPPQESLYGRPAPYGPMQNGAGWSWMWRHHQMMHAYGGTFMWTWLGLVSGVVVILGAAALLFSPGLAVIWGAVILAASLLAMLAGAGGFLGGIIGVIGGTLALFWREPRPEQNV